MASRKGGMTVDIHGLRDVQAVLANIRTQDLNVAKRDLRQGTKKIAQDTLIPALTMAANSSGVPIAPAMAKTMRARTDRIVTVQVGGVNPKLSGFKRGVGAKKAKVRTIEGRAATSSSQSYRTTLAWGSERGPWPGGRAARRDGTRGEPVNHYAVPRSRSHWVVSGAQAPGTFNAVKAAYRDLLRRILREYGY